MNVCVFAYGCVHMNASTCGGQKALDTLDLSWKVVVELDPVQKKWILFATTSYFPCPLVFL